MKLDFTEVTQGNHSFFLTVMPAGLLTKIAYAAVRRQDNEEGAVQRILNQSRIISIKNFALQNGIFPASIVLNWNSEPIGIEDDQLEIPDEERIAQIIDGQHRVAGIRAAIEENPEISNLQLPVAIYANLNTTECANIFLSINTEQRPVPRSLVFDLYGIANEELIDPSAYRARDIAMALNMEDAPYAELIKLPNSPRQKGGIALSTAVSAIKPLVEPKGLFEQVGATSLETQTTIFKNFFEAISEKYGDAWQDRSNAFIYAAGFVGAVDFLKLVLIPYCTNRKSFKKDLISETIKIDHTNLILQDEVKGLGGKDAPKRVYERLLDSFEPLEEEHGAFEL
ncbi:DGQHR domain-containing protein [Aquipseudomonas alcaligenes]|uniref:DNA sulfur modification protein DndB n=1 Tax=Aquipseudomonas alcaligenes TaxID=43263 RepID=UPI000953E38B|nr:DNA sulfur modification protein DndB [Pseudomonas alcaligenes]SIR94512.1 DGQHR domain-containing protein [Pseudomonas alcaligenes]